MFCHASLCCSLNSSHILSLLPVDTYWNEVVACNRATTIFMLSEDLILTVISPHK